ncbi:hypothetical protein MPTK1_5g02290 [Marchantia polymorpha subsp. ruderalis]|uniref:MRN complex-interacting protein N-terminal domain-containing protein n=2 Tax=Marchantia polymorpha TaxID=3197 RepID=A0AAF6BE48_MARPO|nr:hypothetical protein MARPO_0147s0022 [Marchantia polymorpha]BBN10282.1 hypothetical protein Mp_5g02290 [Marchantia polymorpha subsp. ruderalis]|eukprot:PTQ29143.1 hypothetical protein MARPO_0147s0022 [Marchantia polymorpha]
MKFHAVQCFSCGAMQVKQAKKASNKWSCSICNEKQSLRKVFFASDAAKDVRSFVQQANLTRGHILEATAECFNSSDVKENLVERYEAAIEPQNGNRLPRRSNWDDFLQQEDQYSDQENIVDPDDAKYVTSVPDVRPRKPQRRVISSHDGPSGRRALSPQKFADSISKKSRELKESGLQSRFSICERSGVGVGDAEVSVRECENANFYRTLGTPHPDLAPSAKGDCDLSETSLKRGYASLADESRHDTTKAFKTEESVIKRKESVCQTSKWSKYIED